MWERQRKLLTRNMIWRREGGWGLMIWQSFKKAFTKTCWEADEKLGGPPQKMEVNRGVFEKYKDSQVGGGGGALNNEKQKLSLAKDTTHNTI